MSPTPALPQGKSTGEMIYDSTVNVSNPGALKQDNVTVICFTRNLAQTGAAGVSLQQAYATAAAAYSGRRRLASANSSLPIILASGTVPYLAQHPSSEHRIGVIMDFAVGDLQKEAPDSRTARLIFIHGAVMIAVWLVVLPVGAQQQHVRGWLRG
jgi:hypothetical protein